MSKIVVVGSSNTDLVIKTDRIPEPGETVLGGTFMMAAGGKGANQAVAAARLGGDVVFVAKVGDDMFGRQAMENYRKDGLDTRFIFVAEGAASGIATITIDKDGENSIVVAPGANALLSCGDIDSAKAEIAGAEYLLLQLETPMEVVEYAARIAFENGTKVILNPAPAAPLSEELISHLYLITPNRTECSQITGMAVDDIASAETAARKIMSMGASSVIVTLGSRGSLVVTKEGATVVDAVKVAAVDTTAAGDTFNGAVVVALSEGKTLVEAAMFASRASAISVTRMGAQTSIPCRHELE